MLKKLTILLLILLLLAAAGYYLLYTQGAFQTKEDIYPHTNTSTSEMKCAPGKCGASMEKWDTSKAPSKK